MSNRIYKHGNVAILPESVSIFEKKIMAVTNPRESVASQYNPYIENPIFTDSIFLDNGDYIVPDGPDNLFPQRWKMLIQQDSIMPGMLRQKIDLLLSGGLRLVVKNKVGMEIVEDEILDSRIWDWLENMNIHDYLLSQAVDWVYLERNASLMVPNRASRVSAFADVAGFANVQRIPIEDVRMCKLEDFRYEIESYYVSDWSKWDYPAVKYSAYNKNTPLKGVSLFYSLMPGFCSKYYGRPSTIGVANYLSLKLLILNNTKDNVVNAPFRYHIESPMEWWQKIKEENNWSDADLSAFEDDYLEKIDVFLKSDTAENAMKRFHSKTLNSEYGKERLGWTIKLIDDDSEKRITANFKAFESINEHIIAAASIDPSISNIQIQGKLSSGLDKLTAFNIHMLINSPLPRQKILSAVNEAIRINFWTEDYRPVLTFKVLQLATTSKDLKTNSEQ